MCLIIASCNKINCNILLVKNNELAHKLLASPTKWFLISWVTYINQSFQIVHFEAHEL